jgi:hypothetical protein
MSIEWPGFDSQRKHVSSSFAILWNPTALYRESVGGVKGPESEADHSSPSGVKMKNTWSYTSTYSYDVWNTD